jgi:hypothetical protein
VNLEVEMAADGSGVSCLPHAADALAGKDSIATTDQRRSRHVSVEVTAPLPFAVDQQVVAVEDRVIAGAQDRAAAHRDQRRSARRNDVEAFVPATAAAGSAEFADVAADAVRALNGEDVVAVGQTAVGGDSGGGGCGEGREKEKR